MAVQAQYPSNFLFLNRNVQEEKSQLGGDYNYNQQTGEGFFDQQQLIFPNGVEGNRRKRGREMVSNSSSPINPYSLQPHPSQFIDLRLAFGEQQHHHHQQQQSLSSQSSAMYSVLSDDLTAQIRQQRDEIQQFIHAQGEQMRRTLAEKRQRHYRELLVAAEESVSRRLNEKETEVLRAAKRNAELEAQANRLVAETRAWQVRAKAGESTAASLQAQLQQAVMSNGQVPEDMGGENIAEDTGSAYVDPDRVVVVENNDSFRGGPLCKVCRKGVASVVLLPCRHLSMCTDCDRSITNQTCPVCFTYKESSVGVYFS